MIVCHGIAFADESFRMDFEAMMAYILLPPAGGVLLLLLEHKSDYVRYHAWQSALLFSALFVSTF